MTGTVGHYARASSARQVTPPAWTATGSPRLLRLAPHAHRRRRSRCIAASIPPPPHKSQVHTPSVGGSITRVDHPRAVTRRYLLPPGEGGAQRRMRVRHGANADHHASAWAAMRQARPAARKPPTGARSRTRLRIVSAPGPESQNGRSDVPNDRQPRRHTCSAPPLARDVQDTWCAHRRRNRRTRTVGSIAMAVKVRKATPGNWRPAVI